MGERDEGAGGLADTLDLGTQLPTQRAPGEPGDVALPERLGRFDVRGELGRGGMGVVLEAEDRRLRRIVAVKVGRAGEQGASRFAAEAQITSQLQHPNIVPIYDVGTSDDGGLFFVMKKVEGRSLRDLLDDVAAPWSLPRLLGVFVQICNAVAYAHERSVLHRDLKPANVMLGPFGEVYVMDWGLARPLGSTEAHEAVGVESGLLGETQAGTAVGTPGYMSPEQARGDLAHMDGRSDVWSLGAILYEMLTGVVAYRGRTPLEILVRSSTGPPSDPREAAGGRAVPDEIAEVCLRALASHRDDRFPGADDLAAAVQGFLDGSRRREEARALLAGAEELWTRHQALDEEGAALTAREDALKAALPSWAPLAQKADLFATRRALETLAPRRAAVFAKALVEADKALSVDPGNVAARAFLARAYWTRFLAAEARGDAAEVRFLEERVREYDDGRYVGELHGRGTLSLDTVVPAEVELRRLERDGPLLRPTEATSLGSTPLDRVPLAAGSWLLTLRAPGRPVVRYPVQLARGDHWEAGRIELPDAVESFVYVPAGPFRRGGDPDAMTPLPAGRPSIAGFHIREFPVRMREYCEFLTDLHASDPDAAWEHVPRQEVVGERDQAGQYLDRPGPGGAYAAPERDREGDRWDPDWPVIGISWHDASAYVAWRSARDGVAYALPTEEQWEKAARGVDGRAHPWGDGFDPALCKMIASREGRPNPEPVGAFPTDVSVYGVRDMAGGVREWCGDPTFHGDPERRAVRGGSWASVARHCRCADRNGNAPHNVHMINGFRLVLPLEAERED